MFCSQREIQKIKEEWFKSDSFPLELPEPLQRFAAHLKSLNYEDEPNYGFLQSCLDEIIANNPDEPPPVSEKTVQLNASGKEQVISIANTHCYIIVIHKHIYYNKQTYTTYILIH